MQRISSSTTFLYKRVFPIIFFGVLLVYTAVLLFSAVASGRLPSAPLLIVDAFAAAFGYLMMRLRVLDLVDEVLDAGNALVVRNGIQEDRIALSEISNVSSSCW